jgi:vesicle-fusing ATPase
MLDRIGCRIIIIPSGKELVSPICTPAGAMAFGKLLYGGVTRYRMVGGGSNKRKAGERTEVFSQKTKSWLQYGGPIRTYEAVDMGPCALVELLMLPKGLAVQTLDDEFGEEMAVTQMPWPAQSMFEFVPEQEQVVIVEREKENESNVVKMEVQGMLTELNHVEALESTFQSKLGGLSSQVEAIVRRVLDGRMIRPVSDESDGNISESREREAQAMLQLGLQPVKGLLLYGPPGCGKTALAREISKCLDARPPKIVSAPELLDRWVGGSEKLVRSLFTDAELELKQCNGDTTKSALHVIVIDEIDAVFRRRSSAEDSGEVTRASAVNQILSMLDGINSPGNILVIGMTNRRELLDEALLRPGRLEVQVYIPPPDQEGRREILQIHFDALRRKGRLSQPLCQAIDGVRQVQGNSDLPFWRNRPKLFTMPFTGGQIKDLAADQWTQGFSGADIAGLVRSSGSLALSRVRRNDERLENLLVTVEDVFEALKEVKR